MIKLGTRFTANDLKQTIGEIRNLDLRPHFRAASLEHALIPAGNDCFVSLGDLSPQTYSTTQINAYNVESSAKSLDEQLKEGRYKTTYRFAHKYNLPGLTHNQVLNHAYILEYFYNLAQYGIPLNNEKKNSTEQILFDIAEQSYFYAQYIWTFNRDARFDYETKLNPHNNWHEILTFLIGTGYQFHPKDVYEMISMMQKSNADKKQCYAQQRQFKNYCMDSYHIDTGCLVLHRDNQIKLDEILNDMELVPYPIQLVIQTAKNIAKSLKIRQR